MSTPVTNINTAYLTNLRKTLDQVLDEVNTQLQGFGSVSSPLTTGFIEPVNGSLQVQAGLISSSAINGFDAAGDLNTALQNMGGSVSDQLTWLKGVLQEMISEIGNTITSFGQNGELNNESVSQLESDFEQTINSMQQGPSGSSGSSGSSS
jgi:hypothetical protein